MDNKKWDMRFLELAGVIAGWSKDPKCKVGAVIVDQYNRDVSYGFNGFPRGISDSADRFIDQEQKLKTILHAETNAIILANTSLEGCTIYTTPLPTCAHCASMIVQVGITRVVCWELGEGEKQKWQDSCEISKKFYKEAGVEFVTYKKTGDTRTEFNTEDTLTRLPTVKEFEKNIQRLALAGKGEKDVTN